jgi:hypothetical protein
MKRILLLSIIIFFATSLTHAQKGFGVGVGMSTSKAPMIAVKYFVNKNAGSIGFSYKLFNNAQGKNHDITPNSHAITDGWLFYTVDVGYTRILNENFSISGEVSIGKKRRYQNLTDENTNEQYHRFLKPYDKNIVGGGLLLIYNLTDNFGLFAGYNSIREGTLGVQLRFLK